MKEPGCCTLLIVLTFGLSVAAQQDDAVRKALRGTSPAATLGTGIGQVVQPVGKPLIRNPRAPQPPSKQDPATTVQKEPAVEEEEKGPLDPERVKGEYKLEGIPEKEKEGQKTSQKKQLPAQTLSAQTGVRQNYVGGTPSRRNAARVEKNNLPTPTSVPYGEIPKVQTVP